MRETFLQKGSPSGFDAARRFAAGGIEASWKTPLERGFPNLSLNFLVCHRYAMDCNVSSGSANKYTNEFLTISKVFGRGLGEAFLQKGSPSGSDAARRVAAGGIGASWKTPLEKGFSKPFPKLFGSPLLRDGLRYFVIIHADVIFINSASYFREAPYSIASSRNAGGMSNSGCRLDRVPGIGGRCGGVPRIPTPRIPTPRIPIPRIPTPRIPTPRWPF